MDEKPLTPLPTDGTPERASEKEARLEAERRRHAARWRWVGNVALAVMAGLVTMLVFLAGEWGFRVVRGLDFFRIDSLELSGDTQKVPLARMRAAVEPVVAGDFFTADLEAVRAAAESVPWVKRATVRRTWPSGIRIDVEVHRAMALYEDGRLVSDEGVLFSANPEEEPGVGTLPSFYGAVSEVGRIAGLYRTLRETVARIPAEITDIQYSDRETWSLVMQSDVMPPTKVELGRDDPARPVAERLREIAAAYPEVMRLLEGAPSSFDARYPGAFAAGLPDREAERRHREARSAKDLPPPAADADETVG